MLTSLPTSRPEPQPQLEADAFARIRNRRVALVHDWLTGMRGGEKVLEAICRIFPDAPLWTLLHVPGKVSRNIESRQIRTSLLQVMPRAAQKYRHYLPLYPVFTELNKVRDADLVISTSHSVAKSMVARSTRHDSFHVCYIHTPMRYAWDMFDDYFGPRRVGTLASRFVYAPIMRGIREYDKRTASRVDLFLANSTYVAGRVSRFYGRSSQVLAPPVDTTSFRDVSRSPEDWYLIVSALVPYKRVEDAIHACARLGRELKIVGTGPEMANLKRLSAELNVRVEFAGFVEDEDLKTYYARGRALLFPGLEDFGIVPVEAIASGCPVIAFGAGGILDSMTGETAVLYPDQSSAAMCAAIEEFESRESSFHPDRLRSHAEHFSESRFADRFMQLLASSVR